MQFYLYKRLGGWWIIVYSADIVFIIVDFLIRKVHRRNRIKRNVLWLLRVNQWVLLQDFIALYNFLFIVVLIPKFCQTNQRFTTNLCLFTILIILPSTINHWNIELIFLVSWCFIIITSIAHSSNVSATKDSLQLFEHLIAKNDIIWTIAFFNIYWLWFFVFWGLFDFGGKRTFFFIFLGWILIFRFF